MRYSKATLYYFHQRDQYHAVDHPMPTKEGCLLQGKAGFIQNGEVISLYVTIASDPRIYASTKAVIQQARFKAYGSVSMLALCAYVCEWLTDKTLESAQTLDEMNLLTALDLPPTRRHQARLIIEAIKNLTL